VSEPNSAGPFRQASMPDGVVAIRPAGHGRPAGNGPMDAERSEAQ
jgi:hypothetical protein